METKAEIRKRILERRGSLTAEETGEKSERIFSQLCALRSYKDAKMILVYMDYKNEVRTGAFIKKCIEEGKRIALPKVEVHGDRMLSLYEIESLGRDIFAGYKGIPEPNCETLRKIEPTEIDLLVIPGVAFDTERNRLGYGAGYYDRLLPGTRSDSIKAGVAYTLQIVDKIPAGSYDIPMDLVITEDRIL